MLSIRAIDELLSGRAFDPAQPRVLAGEHGGGEWTISGEGIPTHRHTMKAYRKGLRRHLVIHHGFWKTKAVSLAGYNEEELDQVHQMRHEAELKSGQAPSPHLHEFLPPTGRAALLGLEELLRGKNDPDQPRVPKGQHGGGEWGAAPHGYGVKRPGKKSGGKVHEWLMSSGDMEHLHDHGPGEHHGQMHSAQHNHWHKHRGKKVLDVPGTYGSFKITKKEAAALLGPGVVPRAVGSMAKASTVEPVGRKPLWNKPGMHLPPYIQHVANDLIEAGRDESTAIATAIHIVKGWAAGLPQGGEKTVHPDTQAAAAKAVAEWEQDKASTKHGRRAS